VNLDYGLNLDKLDHRVVFALYGCIFCVYGQCYREIVFEAAFNLSNLGTPHGFNLTQINLTHKFN